MPYACLNDCRMFYEVRGEGEAAVFIHGGFPSIDMHLRAPSIGPWTWEADFAAAYRFIAYDRRGCWRSARTETGYGLEDQARDLVALLDHLEVDEAHVIGSSAGGPIAILFAAIYPERTRTLVLAGTAADLWPDDDTVTQIVRKQLEILDKQGAEAAWDNRPPGVELSLDVLWEREEMKERSVLPEYEERIEKFVKQCTRKDLVLWYETQLRAISAYLDRDLVEPCARISVPTRVVHGSNDREVPAAWGRDLAAKIRGAEFIMYPDESHGVVHRCGAVRAELIAFYQKNRNNL